MATIQGIYIALFGRPADPLGLEYWNENTNNGQDLGFLIGRLTDSAEYKDRMLGKDDGEIIDMLYQSLFGRAPDEAGKEFFLEHLTDGTMSLETIAINILNGAKGADALVIANKLVAANAFTASLDTPEKIEAYVGDAAAELGREFLAPITADKASIPTSEQVNDAIGELVNPTLPEPGPEVPGGGGGGGGGGNPPLFDVDRQDDWGNLIAGNKDGFLYAGTGNSADGFAISTVTTKGVAIELGLDMRYKGDGNDVVATNNVFDVDLNRLADVRFAYSVSGIDLKQFSYVLSIESQAKDPSDPADIVTFSLALENGALVWNGPNNSKIDDDGGNLNITQNIEAIGWLTDGFKIGDAYDIKLAAYVKGTQVEVAGTKIQIVSDAPTADLHDTAAGFNGGNTLYVGTGNPNGVSNSNVDFFTVEYADIKLAIAPWFSGTSANLTFEATTTDGVTNVEMDLNSANRFAYSVESGTEIDLSKYKIVLRIDGDSGAGTSFSEFTLEKGSNTAAPGKNNANSEYVWTRETGGDITDDGGDSAGTVTQNIQSFGWYDHDTGNANPLAGIYDVILEAWDKSSNTLVAYNHVIFHYDPI